MSVPFLKKLAVLMGLLVLLWVFYLYRQVPHEQKPFAGAVPAASQILMRQGTQSAKLLKKDGIWQVVLSTATAVDTDSVKMKNLLTGVASLQLEEEISDRPDREADYQIDDAHGTDITFADASGKTLAEGVFGKQAEDFRHSYFRFPQESHVYLARGVLSGDLGRSEASYWRDKQLLDIPEDKIQSIEINGPAFKTFLVSPKKDVWTLNQKPLPPGAADSLIGDLAHLHADDFVDEATAKGLSYDKLTWARVIVKGPASAMDLRFGPPDPKTKRAVVSTGRDTGFAWLSEASLNAILQKPSAFKTK